MRRARIRDERNQDGAYYHLINRVAGTREDRPFGDVEKEHFVNLIHKLATFYTIEVVGYCVMSNHYHLIVWVPHEKPDETEASKRFSALYPQKNAPEPGTPEMVQLQKRICDFSDLAKQLQMQFTAWFNRTRPVKRRGGLWADRFKSLLIEGSKDHAAIWACLAYVELNPVRAKIVADPADYRFSSWGRFCGSGKHPFLGNFTRHLQKTALRELGPLSSADIAIEFRAQLARTIAHDQTGDHISAAEAAEDARTNPSIWLRADRRIRFWTNGVVIGSKAYVQEQYAKQYGEEKAAKHRYGSGSDGHGSMFYSMRRPIPEE